MRKYILFTVALGVLAAGCSKFDSGNLNLKDSLDKSVMDVTKAINTITRTKGYEVLSENSMTMKSETDFRDSITLDLVAGIYDFNPDLRRFYDFFIPVRLFEKTGESDQMVVNMPSGFAFKPMRLRFYNLFDTTLANDFTITASDYHYYYTWFSNFDYKLTADLTLESDDIGTLDVESQGEGEDGRSYSSTYTFTDGYNINVSHEAGDSSVSSFALAQNDEVLLKETRIMVRQENSRQRERTYILSIGNVDIVRGTGIDSIQVYLDGVLQKEAGAVIYDEDSGEDNTFCHNRDIVLTFDDGTTTNLSDLIGPSREVLATLVDSMRSMNFAKHVVDYIAIGIHYHNCHPED